MPRKNEDLLFVLTLLPWWVSAAIAVVAFLCIAYVFPSVSIESPLWAFLIPLQSMATYFGTLVAVVFLLPAALSYIDRTRKKRLLDRQQNLESVRDLPWRQFEELVAEAFRRDGFKVTENAHVGADGGVDIRLRKGGELYLVQCKNWRKQSVGVATVREMFGVLAAESAQRILIVCSGTFTADAVRFAEGKPIDLVDGDKLGAMIARVRRTMERHESTPTWAARCRLTPMLADSNRTGILARRSAHGAGAISSSEQPGEGRMQDGSFWVARHSPNAVLERTMPFPPPEPEFDGGRAC